MSMSTSYDKNNSSNSSNNQNGSTFTGGSQTENDASVSSSVSDYILLPILSLTIIFAVAYSVLILIHPTFRVNKLNWFTINVCMTSVLFSGILLSSSILKVMDTSSSLPCRAQGFLTLLAVCQLMYSHSVVAVSRFLTIVYSNKHYFHSTTCICIGIIIGWLIGFLVAMPFLLVDGFGCSSSSRPAFLPYYTIIVVAVIPVLIVLICNIRIFSFVRQSSRRVHVEGRGNNISQARDVRLIKTMVVTFAVFVIGWIPLFVEQMFIDTLTISRILDNIFQILPALSMLLDVILFIYTNLPVRLFLRQLIVRRHQIMPINPKADIIKTRTQTILKS